MIKKILLIAAVLLPMFASAQTVKIGLVDVQSILTLMPETTQAQNQINEVSKKYDDEYAKLNEEMKRMYDQLNEMKADEPAAIRDRKTREFADYQQKIQQFEQQAMQDLQKMQADLMTPIITKIRGAVETVGREGNYTLIEIKDPQAILYYQDPCVDITNDVKTKLGL